LAPAVIGCRRMRGQPKGLVIIVKRPVVILGLPPAIAATHMKSGQTSDILLGAVQPENGLGNPSPTQAGTYHLPPVGGGLAGNSNCRAKASRSFGGDSVWAAGSVMWSRLAWPTAAAAASSFISPALLLIVPGPYQGPTARTNERRSRGDLAAVVGWRLLSGHCCLLSVVALEQPCYNPSNGRVWLDPVGTEHTGPFLALGRISCRYE
jgi:hypothetical protein